MPIKTANTFHKLWHTLREMDVSDLCTLNKPENILHKKTRFLLVSANVRRWWFLGQACVIFFGSRQVSDLV